MIGLTLKQYQILEKIGAGGQGTVYKALDTKLERTVVVKILPPDLTSKTANYKRFEREARLCSQLDHPNICTIFDFGESGNVHYIAMQYVEGKNVRQLVNGKPLDLQSALSIAIQVCDALAYAHERNIIHRDIKAGNIMVKGDGKVKILDFGLAKLVEEDESEKPASVHKTDLTEIGIPYGTATYAAPEQALGERTDYRADIFSTGVLLYEMLVGVWAFQGKTVIDVRHAVLYDTPKPLSEARPEPCPPQLQKILDKALAKNKKDRYQKISIMRDELRAVLQEVSGVGYSNELYAPAHIGEKNVVKRAWNWIRGKTDGSASRSSNTSSGSQTPSDSFTSQPSASEASKEITLTGISDKKSIAILPFKNLNNDADSSFYEFSLADAVITELAQLKSLVVRPSSVISKYQGKDFDPREVGQELNVNAVLSAGFLRAGEKMRVTAQLLDVESGDILWSDRIDVDTSDIFTVQDKIGQRILEGLSVELTEKEQAKLGRVPTENIEAYEEFLRGRDNFGRFIFRTVALEDCEAAIKNFRHATELDPHFALAYSGLGACYTNKVFKGMGTSDDYTYAEAAFSKAIKNDENVAEARVLMIFIYLLRGEKKKARSEIAILQNKFPNEAPLHFVKAIMHRLDGDYDKSLRSWERLARLDPAATIVSSYNRARVFIYQGLFDEAFAELDLGEKAEPNHPLIKIFRSAALHYGGKTDEAINLIEAVLNEHPDMEGFNMLYAIYLASKGKNSEAHALLTERMFELAKADHDISYWMASVYALLDEKDNAFKWLERSIQLGNENGKWFERDHSLASIRDDERFPKLMDTLHKD